MSGQSRPTAVVSVQVRAEPAFTFERFVRDVDQWWRRGPKYRHAGRHPGTIRFEEWLGGRVHETWTEGGEAREFEMGRIIAWEPPRRFAYTWRNATFAPHEVTEVEVTFQALGGGTLVTVRHCGWERLRPDHPARHGQDDAAFARELGLWWGEQMSALRETIAAG
ncbi:MAG: SRPBCC domain-containing protein [Planctomycetota bacterium]